MLTSAGSGRVDPSRTRLASALLRAGGHAHDPGRELRDGLHQVGLGGHYAANVLVGGVSFVEGASEKCDPLSLEVLPPGGTVELLERPRPAHAPAGAVGGAVHRVLDAEAHREVARVGHCTGDDPKVARAGGGGALAMHDHLLPAPLFGEGEVVVVLGYERGPSPEPVCDALVDDRMVRRGEAAGQANREPVFLPLLRGELQPRQLLRLPFDATTDLLSHLRVPGSDLVAHAPAPRVGEERQIGATYLRRREQPRLLCVQVFGHGEGPEFDEVVAAPRGPELHTRRILQPPEEAGSAPRGVVEDLVGGTAVVAHAGAEEHLFVESALQLVLLLAEDV